MGAPPEATVPKRTVAPCLNSVCPCTEAMILGEVSLVAVQTTRVFESRWMHIWPAPKEKTARAS